MGTVDGTPIWATLAEKLKVNLDLWNLFILGLTYQVRIMTFKFGFNSIKKINFSKKNPI